MNHRLSALLLSACLLLTTPALAAENSTENFVRSKTYYGQFNDLSPSSSYYSNVAALYEYGLTLGKSDGTFGPADPLTVGEIVIFAGRIRSLYRTGNPETGPAAWHGKGQSRSASSLRYLKSEGILGGELDARLFFPATRAETAHVLANVLPPEALPPVYDALVTEGYATHRFITDVTEYTPYFHDILRLYRTGVSQGCDAKGSYHPDALITRGAAAALLTRMVDPSLRTAPTWYAAANRTLASLVPNAKPIPAPRKPDEMDACVRHMLATNSNMMQLEYPSLSAAASQKTMNLALAAVKTYCEQSYNAVSCTYSNQGDMTLVFSSTAAQGATLDAYRTDAMRAAADIHDALWRSGAISPIMSDQEKAQVYFKWICDHTVYDHNAGNDSVSHLPYGLFLHGKAVCDGYTGAYNLLLKLEGIPCTAISNDTHIWTVAELDGRVVHIDTTWGDQEGTCDLRFFAMSPEVSRQYHAW